MFAHFGDLTLTNNRTFGWGQVFTAISDAVNPTLLSLGQSSGASMCIDPATPGVYFSNSQAVNTCYTIDALQQPVYIRIAISPNTERGSTIAAIADAKIQMQAVYNLFLSYGMLGLLAGFALDNVSQDYEFSDGSSWSRSSLNSLITYIHSTFNVGVACICDASLDTVNMFTPAAPYVSPADNNSFIVDMSQLGASPEYTDWIIHLNPFKLQTNGAITTLNPDMTGVMQVVQMLQTFTVPQAVVQHLGFTTPAVSDNGNNIQSYAAQITLMKNMAYFLEVCGINNYYFATDNSFGAASNAVIPTAAYRPLSAIDPTSAFYPNTYGVDLVYIEADGTYIYIYTRQPTGIILLGTFDYTLTPSTVSNVTAYTLLTSFASDSANTNSDTTLTSAFGTTSVSGTLDNTFADSSIGGL